MLFFPEEFFQEEEKCGHMIPAKMKHIWAEELEMLVEVDRICRKYDIKYFVYYGTLLGAVRHQGFIPWDDDVDLCMTREDNNRFFEVVKKEKPSWVVFQSKIGELRQSIHSSVMSSNEIRVDKEYLDMHHGCPYIVGFDVFPFDVIPEEEGEFEAIKVIYGILYRTHLDFENCVESGEIDDNIKYIEDFCNCKIDKNGDIKLQIWDLLSILPTIYNETGGKKRQFYPDYVTDDLKDKNWAISSEYFENIKYVDFENIKVPIPVKYEEILTKLYGENYMIPIKSEGHPFFKIQEDNIKKNSYIRDNFPFKLDV